MIDYRDGRLFLDGEDITSRSLAGFVEQLIDAKLALAAAPPGADVTAIKANLAETRLALLRWGGVEHASSAIVQALGLIPSVCVSPER